MLNVDIIANIQLQLYRDYLFHQALHLGEDMDHKFNVEDIIIQNCWENAFADFYFSPIGKIYKKLDLFYAYLYEAVKKKEQILKNEFAVDLADLYECLDEKYIELNTYFHYLMNKAMKDVKKCQSQYEIMCYQMLMSEISPISLETQFQIGYMTVDIAIPVKKVAIEIDGPHHYNLKDQIIKDSRRNIKIRELLWKIIRYPIQLIAEAWEISNNPNLFPNKDPDYIINDIFRQYYKRYYICKNESEFLKLGKNDLDEEKREKKISIETFDTHKPLIQRSFN